jgi:phage terminase small subunit
VALTARQQRFVEEYALDRNAARAARKAGYSERSAKVTACRLLTNANLQAALEAKEAELAARMDLSRERVIGELMGTVEAAKSQGQAGTVIRGWVEVAKIAGLYAPERLKVELDSESERLRAKFEGMTDEELLALAEGRRQGQ